MQLRGKVALVTGGGTRIGQAITLALAGSGCHVFIHYGRSGAAARATRAKAAALGVETHLHKADLRDERAVLGIVPAAKKRFLRVHVLVNNAGIFPEKDSFTQVNSRLWDSLFAVNLKAPFLLSRGFAAQVPRRGQGKIVNVTDARVRRTGTEHFVYRLTKGGLWQMTEMLARELAPRITVNAVAPGAILPPPGKGVHYLVKIGQSRVPLKRHGSAEMVAEGVLHMLQQDFLTGVVLPVDGGEFL